MSGFDPEQHLIMLKGKEYLEVRWRLVWLRTDHPDAAIETELVRLEEGHAVVRAKVSIPGGGSASGYGSETVSDFGDFMEKAETKAIGRALGALGYGTQFTHEFDYEQFEGGEAKKVVDAPVPQRGQQTPTPLRQGTAPAQRPQQAAQGISSGNVATPAQINAIYAIGRREYRWSDEEIDGYCRNAFGKLPAELTKRDASELIDRLKTTSPAT